MALSARVTSHLATSAHSNGPSCSYPVLPQGALHRINRARCSTIERLKTGIACRAAERMADPVYMQEYEALKKSLLETTRKSGAGLAAYLLFTVDGGAALCALAGSAASSLYLSWLFRDVDNLQPESYIAMDQADKVQGTVPRFFARIAAGYVHALQPRLLVLVALAAATAAWNKVLPDTPLDLAHQGCLLGGFLAYKVPLILRIAKDNVPRGYKTEEMSRPLIERFEDDFDQWGRPKKQLVPLPTEALPDNIDTSRLPVLDLGSKDNEASVTDMAKQMIGFGKDKDKAGAGKA